MRDGSDPPRFVLVSWLLRSGDVLASLDVARTRVERRRGLMGRPESEGAMWIERTRWVHTFGMRFPIDVAHLDADGVVIAMGTLRPHRLGRPVLKARSVVEARAGSFERWRLSLGDRLEVRGP